MPAAPDALAFYLPFHFFFPDWWGVYITIEGLLILGAKIWRRAGRPVPPLDAVNAAKVFLYGHEMFHHNVESFATRLEITHRRPLYKADFESRFRTLFGSDKCLEEALASAYGFARMRRVCKSFPDLDAVSDGLASYIEALPPGYRRVLEFPPRKDFERGRSALLEDYQRAAFSTLKFSAEEIWTLFPHATDGLARVTGRVKYVVSLRGGLARRLRITGRLFTYKDVSRKRQSLAGAELERHGSESHEIWRTKDGRRVVVPRHPGDLKPGTVKSILNQAGIQMSLREFAAAA